MPPVMQKQLCISCGTCAEICCMDVFGPMGQDGYSGAGETVCRSAMERKETRGLHIRTDDPFTNPILNNHFVTIRKTPEGAITSMRPAKTM